MHHTESQPLHAVSSTERLSNLSNLSKDEKESIAVHTSKPATSRSHSYQHPSSGNSSINAKKSMNMNRLLSAVTFCPCNLRDGLEIEGDEQFHGWLVQASQLSLEDDPSWHSEDQGNSSDTHKMVVVRQPQTIPSFKEREKVSSDTFVDASEEPGNDNRAKKKIRRSNPRWASYYNNKKKELVEYSLCLPRRPSKRELMASIPTIPTDKATAQGCGDRSGTKNKIPPVSLSFSSARTSRTQISHGSFLDSCIESAVYLIPEEEAEEEGETKDKEERLPASSPSHHHSCDTTSLTRRSEHDIELLEVSSNKHTETDTTRFIHNGQVNQYDQDEDEKPGLDSHSHEYIVQGILNLIQYNNISPLEEQNVAIKKYEKETLKDEGKAVHQVDEEGISSLSYQCEEQTITENHATGEEQTITENHATANQARSKDCSIIPGANHNDDEETVAVTHAGRNVVEYENVTEIHKDEAQALHHDRRASPSPQCKVQKVPENHSIEKQVTSWDRSIVSGANQDEDENPLSKSDKRELSRNNGVKENAQQMAMVGSKSGFMGATMDEHRLKATVEVPIAVMVDYKDNMDAFNETINVDTNQKQEKMADVGVEPAKALKVNVEEDERPITEILHVNETSTPVTETIKHGQNVRLSNNHNFGGNLDNDKAEQMSVVAVESLTALEAKTDREDGLPGTNRLMFPENTVAPTTATMEGKGINRPSNEQDFPGNLGGTEKAKHMAVVEVEATKATEVEEDGITATETHLPPYEKSAPIAATKEDKGRKGPERIAGLRKKRAEVMRLVGNCYFQGTHGVQVNLEKAVYWLEKAAEWNDEEAIHQICGVGVCYHHGIGVNADIPRAIKLYELSATKGGCEYAMCNLGDLYLSSGRGIAADFEKAVYWFQKGAEINCPHAKVKLGLCYQYGEGVKERDVKKALQLFKEAANEGSKEAMYYLGCIYQKGAPGLEPDWSLALEWFQLSQKQSDENGKESTVGDCDAEAQTTKPRKKRLSDFFVDTAALWAH